MKRPTGYISFNLQEQPRGAVLESSHVFYWQMYDMLDSEPHWEVIHKTHTDVSVLKKYKVALFKCSHDMILHIVLIFHCLKMWASPVKFKSKFSIIVLKS